MCHVQVDPHDPVQDLASAEGKATVRSFKHLRDFFDLKEVYACTRCPKQSSCIDKFKIPNTKFNAGTRDVYQVLLAYGEKAASLENQAVQELSEDALADEVELSPEQKDAATQYQFYGLRMKDALVVLQALEEMMESRVEEKDFFLEKFASGIALYENAAGIDKYKVDQVERKNGQFKRGSSRKEDDSRLETEKIIQPREDKLQSKSSFPGTFSNKDLTPKQKTYLKKFDEHVSTKPIPDTGSKQLPKKRVRGGDQYVDTIKKQVGSTISAHFLKQFKPHRSQNRRDSPQTWQREERSAPRYQSRGEEQELKEPEHRQQRSSIPREDRRTSPGFRSEMDRGQRNQERAEFGEERKFSRPERSQYEKRPDRRRSTEEPERNTRSRSFEERGSDRNSKGFGRK